MAGDRHAAGDLVNSQFEDKTKVLKDLDRKIPRYLDNSPVTLTEKNSDGTIQISSPSPKRQQSNSSSPDTFKKTKNTNFSLSVSDIDPLP